MLRFWAFIIVFFTAFSAFAKTQQQVSKNHLDKKQQADSIFRIALHRNYNEPDTSLVLFSQAYDLYVDLNDLQKQMSCLSKLSWLYKATGRTDTAIVLAFQAAELGEKYHFDTLLAETYLRLGNYYSQLGKLDQSKKFYRKTIKLGYPNTSNGAIGAIGQLYREQGLPDSAYIFLKKSYDYFLTADTTKKSNIYSLSSVCGSLGIVSFQLNNYSQGLDYLNEALRFSHKVGNTKNEISTLINLSIANDILGKPNMAEKELRHALLLSDSIHHLKYKMRVINVMVDHFVDLKNFEKAYNYTVQYHRLQDSLDKIDYNKIIYENELQYNNLIQEEKEKRILAEHRQEQLVTFLGFSVALIIFLYITIMLYRRLKRSIQSKKLHEARITNMEKDMQNTRGRLAFLNEQLNQRNKQIAALLETSKAEEGEIKEQYLKEIEGLTILGKEDWVEYMKVFEGIYPNFMRSIIEKYPNLTEGDKRQLIMLKLGYSRKKAASILGISPESVKKGQQRLSKKLQLDDVTQLQDFIREF